MPATDHFFRNQNKLHVVFAISCVALLVSVVMMMAADQADEWRDYQRTGFELDAAVKERDLAAIRSDEFEQELQAKKDQKGELEAQLAGLGELDEEIVSQLDVATREVDALTLELKSQNALRDEARAHYDLGIRDGFPAERLDPLKAAYEAEQATADTIQLELEDAEKRKDEIGDPGNTEDPERKQLLVDYAQITGQLAEVDADIEKLQANALLVEAALESVRPTGAAQKMKRGLMELPIIDGFNSHLKVKQDWLPDLHQTLGMTSIARFDRCRTCHLNVDKVAPGGVAAFPGGETESDQIEDWVEENKFPHPFATHPNHELFVTAASPHPVSEFGCTICHDGQGSGTSFGNAEHTPNDPFLAEEWHHEYGFHPNHFWEYPMQPERFQESTCIKCHHNVVELETNPKFGASAPKVSRGYNLIRKYGCFGCHEIHGFDAGKAIGPDMRLEPQTAEDAQRIEEDPNQFAGKFRKVGPSLRHISAKTSEDFIAYWTEVPGRYRPTTKMPQFFNLTNQEDELAQAYEAVELAGLAHFLTQNSEPIELLSPAGDYSPNAERGKQLFSERGCLACHQHSAVPGTTADFGPNISDIHQKVKRNADDAAFSDWLYTWVKEPERHHKRTKMPNLYLDSYADKDGATIDPAADIVAFLLSQGEAEDFSDKVVDPATVTVKDEDGADVSALDSLVTLFLRKSRFSKAAVEQILATKTFPQKAEDVAGDELVLATDDGSAVASDEEWHLRKLDYIGRRTVSRYGCYACHDIPGYESARPIGVALQDWGRKDTSKLGLEHIEEFLHHHGEPDGSSTAERAESAMKAAEDGTLKHGDPELEEELSVAYFYDSLLHHGRPGFIWQKLRGPRSYDYMKTETKGYDERLRMPKFPLKEDEVEAIATFVLGLVADPPAEKYIYQPDVREKNRIGGEFLLAKYNCTGCHVVDLPKVTFGVDIEEDIFATSLTAQDHENSLELLLNMRKPKNALTGETGTFTIDGEEVELPLASFHGFRMVLPDPEEEDPEYRETGLDTWETIDFGEGDDAKRLLPGSRVTITDSKMVSYEAARGGQFAEWLVDHLVETRTGGNRNLAWQASPPALYQEGLKVQTPWLYQFLLEPDQLRYTTVLRMPRFNMSQEEAQTLANYFAAVDGAEFPYQELQPADIDYVQHQQQALTESGLLAGGEEYLGQSWKLLNGPLCIKCHSVGGRKFKVSDPAKDIQGPNLNRVQQRLRADWVRLWLYKPTWITPYTSMPMNYPHNAPQFPDLFKGDPGTQVEATRDALFNYSKLLEDRGSVVYTPPAAEGAEAAADSVD